MNNTQNAKTHPSIDWKEIGDPLVELMKATSNLIEREFPAKYHNVDSAGLLFMTRFRLSINTFNAILYLIAETPKDPHRYNIYVLAISPLVRTLFEDLITFVFLIHDVEKYSSLLFKTEYKETQREIEFAQKYHAAKLEWAAYIKRLQTKLKHLEKIYSITPQEIGKIKSYPTPGGMKNIILEDHPNSQFLPFYDFINSWMYRELSLSSHMDTQNLKKRGIHFSRPLAKRLIGEDYKKKLDEELKEFRSKEMFTVATLLLAIMTEITSDFKFEPRYRMKPRLKVLWEKVIQVSDIAKDFYDYSYNAISK